MSNSRNDKRLDEIEIELTPKDWAIRLADAMRCYPDQKAFFRAIANGTFRESPYMKPFFVLAQQAEDRHPGQKPEHIRARQELNQKLRREYQALKGVINTINKDIEVVDRISRSTIQALSVRLHGLILQDAFSQTAERTAAWIERREVVAVDEEERQWILKELANIAIASGPRTRLASLAQDWADDAASLFMTIVALKEAVETVQERYFDRHAILSRDIEGALEITLEMTLEIIATFNEYLSTRANGLRQDSRQQASEDRNPAFVFCKPEAGTLSVDVESIRGYARDTSQVLVPEWVNAAKHAAIVSGGVEEGFAILRDPRGPTHFLLISTTQIPGIESSIVLLPSATNYFAKAWDARTYVDEALHRSLPPDDIGLAINSAISRSQDQLHIHIDCVRADVVDALHQNEEQIGNRWAPFRRSLVGHQYLAMWVPGDTLGSTNPFRLLAESSPDAARGMGNHTLAVVELTRADGTKGFVILAGQVNRESGDLGIGEELLDHSCRIATIDGQVHSPGSAP